MGQREVLTVQAFSVLSCNMGAVSIATSGTAALINLIIIMLLNKVLELPFVIR